MPMTVRKAGIASSKRFQSTSRTLSIISAPTTISAGAVASGGTAVNSGASTSEARKRIATTTPVRPVRPPSSMPVADSM